MLWPKFDDPEVGDKLAFTGAVKDEVTDLETLSCRLLETLAKTRPNSICERYKLDSVDNLQGWEMLELIGKKRGFLIKGGEIDYENKAYELGFDVICGVDEAGRGPLAGPVYAAAVILPRGYIVDGVNDSKKLSEKKRDLLFDKIVDECVCYSVGTASVEEIDKINILQATFLAMRRAVDGLSVKPDIALIDGNKKPGLDIEQWDIVKGDATSANIAAASIIEKVSRDRYMLKLAEKYPQYQFEKHKGYGTKLHYEMLDKYGISEVHRKTFLKKYLEKKNEQQR